MLVRPLTAAVTGLCKLYEIFYDTLNTVVLCMVFTQDHMGLKISKCCSSYSVHPISAIFYDDIAYHGGPGCCFS